GSVSCWFGITSKYLLSHISSLSNCVNFAWLYGLNILRSDKLFAVRNGLHKIWFGLFEMYIDGLLKDVGSADITSSAAMYFPVLDISIDVAVCGLLFFIMAKLQVVVLFLKCVPPSSTVVLHLNSQAAINVCILKLLFAISDFHNWCWIKRQHIFNLIRDKNFIVNWVKIKDHSGVVGNVKTNSAAGIAVQSSFLLLAGVRKCGSGYVD
ncbi:hypothetical protein G9A89_016075, partial [Geosiphon pyriformis]